MIVLDIETIPIPESDMTEWMQGYVERECSGVSKQIKDPAKREMQAESEEAKAKAVKKRSVDPWLCRIVSIGMITGVDAVNFTTGNREAEKEIVAGGVSNKAEKSALEVFWETVLTYGDDLLTFNGKSFDVPVILARSALHGIRQTRILQNRRYSTFPHLDLQEVLEMAGGIREMKSLEFYLNYFKVSASKGGFNGSMVYNAVMNDGKAGLKRVMKYNLDDCRALLALYRRVGPTLVPIRSQSRVDNDAKNPY